MKTILYRLYTMAFPNSWETFLVAVSGRESQPNFDRLWHDCLEEKGRIQSKTNSSKEGNLALTAKTKKFKKPFPPKNKEKKPQGKQLDVSKIQCFNSHKMGHYARDCRQSKKRFKRSFQASTAEEEEPKKKKSAKSSKQEESRR